MLPGFDPDHTFALLVHGYVIDNLVYETCRALAEEVSVAVPGFVAAPNGDLGPTGSPNEDSPQETVPFSFVVGVPIAIASTRATQETNDVAPVTAFDEASLAHAVAAFARGHAALDDLLQRHGVSPGRRGEWFLAAGPLANAILEAEETDPRANIALVYGGQEPEDAGRRYALSWDGEPDAVRVLLNGRLTLRARYS
jgi:hypothetical protein